MLGRSEVRIGLEALLDRLDDFALTGPEPVYADSYIVRAITSLPLTFTVRAGSGRPNTA